MFQGKFGEFNAPHRGSAITSGKRALYMSFFQTR